MGCLSTKSQDIKNSRERIPQHGTQAGKGEQSVGSSQKAPPLSTGKKINEGPENVAESYSDLRNKEKEMFQSILNRTAMNLIDVGQSPAAADEHQQEDDEHEGNNEQHVNTMIVDNPAIFGLPIALDAKDSPVREALAEHNLVEQDAQLIKDLTNELSQAFLAIAVNDHGIGPIVVTLPEVDLS